jgi:predicted PurR-regulated permease PerM
MAIAAIGLFWGSWAWMVVAAVVAVVEFVALRRSERFSARLWRSVPAGRRHRREQGTETIYVVSAIAGAVLFVIALVQLFL